MCLAIPARVLEVNGQEAVISVQGVQRTANLMLLEESIQPGDYILGDRDGTLLIPAEHAEFVIAETVRTMATDGAMRTAIRAGRDPYDAFLEFGKL